MRVVLLTVKVERSISRYVSRQDRVQSVFISNSQNTIICLTSNIGSDILAHESSTDRDGKVTDKAKDEVLERTSAYFPPELLNRLDTMLVFNKLSRQSILRVVDLRLRDVAERLQSRRITIEVDDAAKIWLAQKGYSELYGARAIARIVRTDVLFPLAQKLLRGTIRYVNTHSHGPWVTFAYFLSQRWGCGQNHG